MEDSQIIALFFERSELAIYRLSQKYGAYCQHLASNILRSRADAEECVNDTYLAVWNTVPPLKPQSLAGYVCRIARNIAVTRYHSNTAAKRNSYYDTALEELEYCFASADSVEDSFDAKETAKLIDRFLLELEEDSRSMFVRRYYFAQSVGEIASSFGRSSHYVSVKLSRIRNKLKSYLEKEGVML